MNKTITIIAFLISFCFYGQTYQTLNKVKIEKGKDLKFKKKVTVNDCELLVPAGSVIKKETIYKSADGQGETTNTVITETKYPNETTIKTSKTIEIPINSFNGKANVYVDEKDKSILHVNYWLGQPITIKKGTNIQIIKRKIDCNKNVTEVSEYAKLEKDSIFDLWKCNVDEESEDFIKYSDKIIKVFNDQGTVDYLLVDKYNKNNDYTIALENRDYVTFKNSSIVFGPITIPIKYRKGYNKNDIAVNEEFKADLNIGVFGGWTFGKQRFRYERGVGIKELATWSTTIGPFVGFSSETLNKSNTTAGNNPFIGDKTKSIGVVSPGIGIVKTVYNFNFGFYYGWDLGIGKESNNWNFQNKPWLGVGIGYSLTGFWKK